MIVKMATPPSLVDEARYDCQPQTAVPIAGICITAPHERLADGSHLVLRDACTVIANADDPVLFVA